VGEPDGTHRRRQHGNAVIEIRPTTSLALRYRAAASRRRSGSAEPWPDDPAVRSRDRPPPRVVVEGVRPSVDGGAFPAKASVGEQVPVTADVFAEGHDVVVAELRYRRCGGVWHRQAMRPLGNDRFGAWFVPDEQGPWEFAVAGWVDGYETWRRDTVRKRDAGQDLAVDLIVGAELLERSVGADGEGVTDDARMRLRRAGSDLRHGRVEGWLEDPELTTLARALGPKRGVSEPDVLVPMTVDRERARFSSWYELFPRSTWGPRWEDGSGRGPTHGSLRDVVDRLDRIASMGFDVVYLPPIHPIGATARKGPDNDPAGGPDAVGSPWAIGSPVGGHTAVHPDLGTVEDLEDLARAARARGLEIALDLAFQCSPDHPWIREHPSWFRHRPDGTIQHAENPPKRYEDIVPLDFESEDWTRLWQALREVVVYWVDRGVRIFRVDNPHTKPFAFWQWLISTVKEQHPDVLFLSEAFTRPRVMERLAKLGFTQSYTYFAWYDSKSELEGYFRDLSERTVDFMRPNAWPNTPDILTEFLAEHGRPAFVLRAVLAATLCANWGVYGPAFELVEHVPVRPGSEEYRHSEKYEVRHWDVDDPEGLAPLLTRLNAIRRAHPALQQDRTLRFHGADDPEVICYTKQDPRVDDIVLVVVNLDPRSRRSCFVHLHLHSLGIGADESFDVVDELGGGTYRWYGGRNYVDLDPHGGSPAHVFRLHRDRDPEWPR
jgi:starch synthase (maltosyl-transferring)